MRKQNSTFKTAFISEAGSELKNNDYFAYVELDQFACYVVADGLNDMPDAESAKLAIETVLLAFEDHPSIRKKAVLSYLKAAHDALTRIESQNRLKASVTVVVSNYEKLRYGYAGNTRLRLYRDGNVLDESIDMSLSRDLVEEQKLPEDALARHEERNNLYCYVGQEEGFHPYISGKLRWADGDILALYTRGIWENLSDGELDDVFSDAKDDPGESLDSIEDLLLSRQPGDLENYTFVAVFADKVFRDPNRKRKIKKIITVAAITLVVVLVITLVVCLIRWQRGKWRRSMNTSYANTIEYIEDNNFLRAKEECRAGIKTAQKLMDRKTAEELTNYLKLIDSINVADDSYDGQKYEEAQAYYVKAREKSRYADHVADQYIDTKLNHITNYLSVFDYIQMGDTLAAQSDYGRAEEKYLEARSLATRAYYEDGRKQALEKLYSDRDQSEEEANEEAKAKAAEEAGAAELMAQGDKAYAESDYEGAKAYYSMAVEKYQKLDDTAHSALINTKIQSCNSKLEEINEKKWNADNSMDIAREAEKSDNYVEAKSQYLTAQNIYKELDMDDKVEEVDGKLELLEVKIETEKEESKAEKGEYGGRTGEGE